MRILGTCPLGAYLVRARAVVRPAMPPPRMMMSRPSFEAGAMVSVWVLETDTAVEEGWELEVCESS
jgi:hypothetical protein